MEDAAKEELAKRKQELVEQAAEELAKRKSELEEENKTEVAKRKQEMAAQTQAELEQEEQRLRAEMTARVASIAAQVPSPSHTHACMHPAICPSSLQRSLPPTQPASSRRRTPAREIELLETVARERDEERPEHHHGRRGRQGGKRWM
jgi:hypothetical protein